MSLGHGGRGNGYTMQEGDRTTGIAATKYFSKIAVPKAGILAIQVNFNEDATATAVGVMTIQGSNFPEPTDQAAGTREWDTLDVAFNRAVTAGAGLCSVNLALLGWRWIRVVYTRTSGTGSLFVQTCMNDV